MPSQSPRRPQRADYSCERSDWTLTFGIQLDLDSRTRAYGEGGSQIQRAVYRLGGVGVNHLEGWPSRTIRFDSLAGDTLW